MPVDRGPSSSVAPPSAELGSGLRDRRTPPFPNRGLRPEPQPAVTRESADSARRHLAICMLFALLVGLGLLQEGTCLYNNALRSDSQVALEAAVDSSWPSHKVDPDKELLSILVTIYPSDSELGFLHNQLQSFAHFFRASSIKDYLLVAPRAQMQKLQSFARKAEKELGMPAGLLRAIPEDWCTEQFNPRHPTMGTRKNGQPVIGGWVKQQIVKLACAKLVQTPFYMILDADILFARPQAAVDLFNKFECSRTSPVCDLDAKIGFQSRNDAYPLYNRTEEQKIWMRNAAATLQLDVPVDWRIAQGVTPQIISKDIVLNMGAWVETRFNRNSWVAFLLEAIIQDKVYQEEEKRGIKWFPPWTEFTLYWIYATHSGAWDYFHSVTQPPIAGGCVWARQEFEAWLPCNGTHSIFEDSGWALTLVQSSSGITSLEVWSKFQPCLTSSSTQKS